MSNKQQKIRALCFIVPPYYEYHVEIKLLAWVAQLAEINPQTLSYPAYVPVKRAG
jgi:hypothetical protein